MKLARILVATAIALNIALAAGLALAEPSQLDRAKQLEADGEHYRAARAYTAAYEQLGDPRLMYYVARNYAAAGRPRLAAALYRRYLSEVDVPTAHRADVEARIAALDAQPQPTRRIATASPPRPIPAPTPPRTLAPGLFPPSASFHIDDDRLEASPGRPAPPLSGGRLAGEFLLGELASFGGGIAGLALAFDKCGSPGCAIVSVGGGLALGSTLGVYIVGAAGDETGSFGSTFLGALGGTATGVLMLATSESDDLIPLALAMPTIGAMIGFNATRRYDADATVPALVSYRNGGVSVGVPALYPIATASGESTTALSLVGGSF